MVVKGEAVELGYEALSAPKHVYVMPRNPLVYLWLGEAVLFDEDEEEILKHRARGSVGPINKRPQQAGGAASVGIGKRKRELFTGQQA